LGVRPLDKLYLRMRLLGIPVEALFRSPESGNGPVVVAVVAIVVPQLIVVVPPKIPIPVPDTFCTRAFTYLCERRHGAAHQQHRGYYKHQDFRLQRFPPLFPGNSPVELLRQRPASKYYVTLLGPSLFIHLLRGSVLGNWASGSGPSWKPFPFVFRARE
jgi:hypothetical protein